MIKTCLVCAQEFNAIQWNSKYCCDKCKAIAKKLADKDYYRRNAEAIKEHQKQKRNSEEHRDKERKRKQSEAYRKWETEYRQTEACKELHRNYERSERYKEIRAHYRRTEARKESQRRYSQSSAFRESQKRYRQSERGITTRKAETINRRAAGIIPIAVLAKLNAVTHCPMCGCEFDNSDSCRKRTVDHILPIKHGGDNSPQNLRALCQSCNSRKSAKIGVEWGNEMRCAKLN